jgi:hypothetical protein
MGNKNSGRVPKLEQSPEIGDAIISLVSSGTPQGLAAELAGINECTFYAWLKRAETEKGPKRLYRDFSKRIREARASYIRTHLGNISTQGARSWQASAWILQHCANGGGRHFVGPEISVRYRLEELEKEFEQIRKLALEKGVIEGGADAMPEE